ELHVRAQVHLGGLSVDDVTVELVYGSARADDDLVAPERLVLEPDAAQPDAASSEAGTVQFAGRVPLAGAGRFGYTVRVLPRHPRLTGGVELGLVAVASGSDHA